jgi:long-chain acyl-CoA synthetase
MQYRNLAELQRRQAERLGPRIALRYRKHGLFSDVTWELYRADSVACAAALVDAGVQPGDRVALLAENRIEWLVADMGILTAAAINVPPHAPLTAKQVQFQLEDAEACWAFVSNAAQLEKLRHVRSSLPKLRGIVVFDPNAAGADAVSWAGFLQAGRRALPRLKAELEKREANLDPDDLATIMYTSGTTGNPKGVMLTHANLLSNALASLESQPIKFDSIVLSWLPYSHIYARTVDHYEHLAAGSLLCLADSVETLVADLDDVKPTHFASVPRFYEKVLTAVATPDPEKTAKNLRRVFGPRIQHLSSGGAPLPNAVCEAYLAAGLPMRQGYGLTESSPVISFNRTDKNKIGTVGLPLPGVEIKIGHDGEVLTRGPHVMKGYWKNPQATAETIRDGWLHTGDLGSLDADGFLSITGRKKELMVLSNGKKLVPTQIEGLLLGESCIDQVVVYGEGRNFLTALVVPQWDNLRKALRDVGDAVDSEPAEKLAVDERVKRLLQRKMDAALADVASWEQVKRFVILPQPFTVAAEELTVSLKLRRNVIFDKYRAPLEALYRDNPNECG